MPNTAPENASDSPFAVAHRRVCELCGHFDARRGEIMSPGYKEDAARNEFITPFFEALGWDVRNTAHRSVYEKDVVTEKREDIAGTARSADYAFRRPGTHLTAFFVEAKKPSVDIRGHGPCYQAVLYGWNASTPLVILTDFEQFLILDARSRPDKNNAVRHILRQHGSYTIADYRDPEKFAEIWGLLAREHVAAGSLDKAAAALPRLSGRIQRDDLFARGTRPVDEEFLAQMELWREKLAKSLKRSNHHLDGGRLTSLTQRILDRLVFLRFLGDRGIERDFTFADLGRSGSAWSDFLKISRRLDARYNGIIYKKDEHGCEDPALVMDDPAFAGVVENLIPQNSDYLFGSISVTILGSIYERFLGKVIVARDKTAIVEWKPENRKASGVYYTPDYIVRYIVEQTVGRRIEGKKPAEIGKLRFADIACGSGSFLVEVFACLIRFHLAWYLGDGAEKWEKKGILRKRETDGDHVLALAEKRRILLANIYGVDLDPQAVEVTQLSLYLKLMEDESFPSTQSLFDFEKHALLPSLWNNIICGNSLIENDVADLFGLSPEAGAGLRPLDLAWSFGNNIIPDKATGAIFDAVVGNPPYVRQEQLKELKGYLEKKYECFSGTGDLYTFFMERAIKFLKPGARYGIIVSSSFLRANFGGPLRATLKKHAAIERVVDFGGLAVFAEAKDTYVCIPLFSKTLQPPRIEIAHICSLDPTLVESQMRETSYTIPYTRFSPGAWSLASDAEIAVFDKLCERGTSLGKVVGAQNFFRGVTTGLNDAFIVSRETRDEIIADGPVSAEIIYPIRGGEDVREYFIRHTEKFIIFTRRGIKPQRYPAVIRYLEQFKADLEPKQRESDKRGRKPGKYKWYEIQDDVAYYDIFGHPKIVFPDICKNPRFCYDDTGIYISNTAYALGTGDKYLLGLLNSRVFWFCIRHISIPFGVRAGEFRFRLIAQYMEQVPIRVVNLGDPADKSLHDKLVSCVDKMLAAKKAEAQGDGAAREAAARQCDALDRQINGLVYELYGLTEEQIAIVECS